MFLHDCGFRIFFYSFHYWSHCSYDLHIFNVKPCCLTMAARPAHTTRWLCQKLCRWGLNGVCRLIKTVGSLAVRPLSSQTSACFVVFHSMTTFTLLFLSSCPSQCPGLSPPAVLGLARAGSGVKFHILVSGPSESWLWKESRMRAASAEQRWPKALLYHSGDSPLK